MFEDRRRPGDRRSLATTSGQSRTACRRRRDRRDIMRQYYPIPWWLQTNYAEEVAPPVLVSKAAESVDQALAASESSRTATK